MSTAAIALTLGTLSANPTTTSPMSSVRMIIWGARGLSVGVVEQGRVVPASVNPPENFTNITDISASAGHIDIVSLEGVQSFPVFSLYQWRPDSNAVALKTAVRGLISAQTSADGELGALITCQSEGCDVDVRKLATGDQLAQWPRVVARTAKVSWLVDGKSIVFDGEDGWVKTATIANHVVTNIAKGRAPAVSPSGTQVAYVSNNDIRVRSLDSGQDRQVYSSNFFSQQFVGRLHWSFDGREIIANREAGWLGYDTECVVIDANREQVNSFKNGGLWCGPSFEIPNK